MKHITFKHTLLKSISKVKLQKISVDDTEEYHLLNKLEL